MWSRGEKSEGRGQGAGGSGDGSPRATRGQWLAALGLLAVLCIAAVSVAVLVTSGPETGTKAENATQTPAATPDAGASTTESAAVPAVVTGPIRDRGATTRNAVSEALPPDVSVALADTLVQPGEPIEIDVQATSDVTQLVLSDGIDNPEAFVRDTGSDVWRVSYRVPLRPRGERIALSVTATNAVGRWRRVWAFLHVHPEPVEAAVDTLDHK